MHPISAKRLAILAGAALVLVALADPAFAQNNAELNRRMAGVLAAWAAKNWGIALISVGGMAACARLGGKAGAACAVAVAGFAANYALADSQGQRIEIYDTLPTTFAGSATDLEGQVSYEGTRVGAMLQGTYAGEDGAGDWQGVLQRNGTISGSYREEEEAGAFSGAITPELNQIFGTAQCTSGCDDDE
jgi:hypothetical protein